MKEVFRKNIKKGFNLVEILLSLTLIGVLVVGFVPVLTKRIKAQRSNDADCVNGLKMEHKEFSADANFSINDNIAGPVTFILIGAGGNGQNATFTDCTDGNTNGTLNAYGNNATCSLGYLTTESVQNEKFYYNVIYNAVGEGESADCTHNQAGASGLYIKNRKLSINKALGNNNIEGNAFSHSINGNNNTINWDNNNRISGGSSSSFTLMRLDGGVPPTNIYYTSASVDYLAGVGGSCKLNSTRSAYVSDSSPTQGACNISCKIGTPGIGGASGAYLKFSQALGAGDNCQIAVGEAPSGATTVQCNSGTVYTTANGNNLPAGAIYNSSQNGDSPGINNISGGSGGSVLSRVDNNNSSGNIVFSQGANGGCFGKSSAGECSSVNGGNGYLGSGGGGGSCSDNGCGIGGRGGDGLVIVEYKVQCE